MSANAELISRLDVAIVKLKEKYPKVEIDPKRADELKSMLYDTMVTVGKTSKISELPDGTHKVAIGNTEYLNGLKVLLKAQKESVLPMLIHQQIKQLEVLRDKLIAEDKSK